MSFLRPNRYQVGISPSATNNLSDGFFGASVSTIANGQVSFQVTANGGNTLAINHFTAVDGLDDYIIMGFGLAGGGADTVASEVYLSGERGRIICQINVGGFVIGLFIVPVRFHRFGLLAPTSTSFIPGQLNTTGTPPTACSLNQAQYSLRYDLIDWADVTGTAVDYQRELIVPRIDHNNRIFAIAANDMQTSNDCVWGGIASSGEDNSEGNTGLMRRSFARFATTGINQQFRSTWSLPSLTSCMMAAAMVRMR